MTNRNPVLTTAAYPTSAAFYEGPHYELDLSFDTLRDKQWQRVMETIWQHPSFYGPLTERYYPGAEVPEKMAVQAPPPTATLTQHGQMQIGEAVIGVDIQATRSLFECVSILIPVAMFAGLTPAADIRQKYPAIQALDEIFYNVALKVFEVCPFQIAAFGYERECQLPMELSSDSKLRDTFLASGNALVQDTVLSTLQANPASYEQVLPRLRWLPPAAPLA